jgi:hypothetical protein
LSDATEHALATIASILDQPETPREAEKPASESIPVAPAMPDGDDYTRIGPGPIAAIRFKWTARPGDNGEYFVDETIGENSVPIVSGPMTKEAAFALVDERASAARERFEQLRHEMTGRAAAADFVRKGEA